MSNLPFYGRHPRLLARRAVIRTGGEPRRNPSA